MHDSKVFMPFGRMSRANRTEPSFLILEKTGMSLGCNPTPEHGLRQRRAMCVPVLMVESTPRPSHFRHFTSIGNAPEGVREISSPTACLIVSDLTADQPRPFRRSYEERRIWLSVERQTTSAPSVPFAVRTCSIFFLVWSPRRADDLGNSISNKPKAWSAERNPTLPYHSPRGRGYQMGMSSAFFA